MNNLINGGKITMKKILKYTSRVIVFPFVVGIIAIFMLRKSIEHSWNFLKYGGEFIRYDSYKENELIAGIYKQLKEQYE